MRQLTAPATLIAGFLILSGVLPAQDSKAQNSGATNSTQVTQGVSKTGLGGVEYPCNGKIKSAFPRTWQEKSIGDNVFKGLRCGHGRMLLRPHSGLQPILFTCLC